MDEFSRTPSNLVLHATGAQIHKSGSSLTLSSNLPLNVLNAFDMAPLSISNKIVLIIVTSTETLALLATQNRPSEDGSGVMSEHDDASVSTWQSNLEYY